jgi:hypothetical protein
MSRAQREGTHRSYRVKNTLKNYKTDNSVWLSLEKEKLLNTSRAKQVLKHDISDETFTVNKLTRATHTCGKWFPREILHDLMVKYTNQSLSLLLDALTAIVKEDKRPTGSPAQVHAVVFDYIYTEENYREYGPSSMNYEQFVEYAGTLRSKHSRKFWLDNNNIIRPVIFVAYTEKENLIDHTDLDFIISFKFVSKGKQWNGGPSRNHANNLENSRKHALDFTDLRFEQIHFSTKKLEELALNYNQAKSRCIKELTRYVKTENFYKVLDKDLALSDSFLPLFVDRTYPGQTRKPTTHKFLFYSIKGVKYVEFQDERYRWASDLSTLSNQASLLFKQNGIYCFQQFGKTFVTLLGKPSLYKHSKEYLGLTRGLQLAIEDFLNIRLIEWPATDRLVVPSKEKIYSLASKYMELPDNAIYLFDNTSEAKAYRHLFGIQSFEFQNFLVESGFDKKLSSFYTLNFPDYLDSREYRTMFYDLLFREINFDSRIPNYRVSAFTKLKGFSI